MLLVNWSMITHELVQKTTDCVLKLCSYWSANFSNTGQVRIKVKPLSNAVS